LLYPKDMGGRTELDYYAEQFDTVEVNNSFYRLPAREVFESWRERVPEGFLYAVKASRYLTHMKRLREPVQPLQRLMDRAEGLGDKLGPLLFQLPPNFAADLNRLAVFMAALERHHGRRFAIEFRHPSWLVSEVYEMLHAGGVALCLPVGMKLPVEVRLTTEWSYIRMHRGRFGIGFSDSELKTWPAASPTSAAAARMFTCTSTTTPAATRSVTRPGCAGCWRASPGPGRPRGAWGRARPEPADRATRAPVSRAPRGPRRG